MYQQIKVSECNVKFCKKGVLKAAKLVHANNTKSLSLSRNMALNIGKSAVPPNLLSNGPELLYSSCAKKNCLLQTFLRTLALMNDESLYLLSLLELIWNYVCNIYVTPMLVQKVVTNLDLSKVKGIWSWLDSSGDSEELWALTFTNTTWTFPYVSEEILFPKLLERLICDSFI